MTFRCSSLLGMVRLLVRISSMEPKQEHFEMSRLVLVLAFNGPHKHQDLVVFSGTGNL